MVTGNDFAILNKIYGDFLNENSAFITHQVIPLPSRILISVECIALYKKSISLGDSIIKKL
jgi:hypothetical protein